jgi:phage repressor protein C with HTH and peptisase S24 domain
MELQVNERLISLIDVLTRGNEKKFAESIGVKPAVINNYTTGKQQSKPGFEVLRKILDVYPDVNMEWLLAGKGEMLKSQRKNAMNIVVATQDTTGNFVVPVINRKAAANYLTGHQTQEYFEQLDALNLPPTFKRSSNPSYALQVAGDSMMPTLYDGDLVICTLTNPSDWEYLNDGEVYVVVSENGLQVKRMKNRLNTHQDMLFISDNKAHKPFALHADEILELWKVHWKLSTHLEENHDDELVNKLHTLESRLERLEKKYIVE